MFDNLTSNKGSALLIVVILMSITILMGTIMFNYSLRNLRLTKDINDLKKAETAAQTGLTDTIEIICDRLDNGIPIGSFFQNNNNVFAGESGYTYSVLVNETGYNPLDYISSSHIRSIKIKKGIENTTITNTTLSAIAIETTGQFKSREVMERVLIDIGDTDAEYFYIVIHD